MVMGSPIRSVIIRRVINKIPICVLTSMITHRIGGHKILLPVNRMYNKIGERNKRKNFQEKNSFHPRTTSTCTCTWFQHLDVS